jgi:hypothetical protein
MTPFIRKIFTDETALFNYSVQDHSTKMWHKTIGKKLQMSSY